MFLFWPFYVVISSSMCGQVDNAPATSKVLPTMLVHTTAQIYFHHNYYGEKMKQFKLLPILILLLIEIVIVMKHLWSNVNSNRLLKIPE